MVCSKNKNEAVFIFIIEKESIEILLMNLFALPTDLFILLFNPRNPNHEDILNLGLTCLNLYHKIYRNSILLKAILCIIKSKARLFNHSVLDFDDPAILRRMLINSAGLPKGIRPAYNFEILLWRYHQPPESLYHIKIFCEIETLDKNLGQTTFSLIGVPKPFHYNIESSQQKIRFEFVREDGKPFMYWSGPYKSKFKVYIRDRYKTQLENGPNYLEPQLGISNLSNVKYSILSDADMTEYNTFAYNESVKFYEDFVFDESLIHAGIIPSMAGNCKFNLINGKMASLPMSFFPRIPYPPEEKSLH